VLSARAFMVSFLSNIEKVMRTVKTR